MTDHVPPEKRSLIMAAVHSKNTTPEKVVRSMVHKLGYRYRLYVNELPGKPDMVFPKRQKIIFLHGCFWHRHTGCRYATLPKTHVEFWQEKFRANLERDRRTKRKLRKMGWTVLVVWQCELKNREKLVRRLDAFLAD